MRTALILLVILTLAPVRLSAAPQALEVRIGFLAYEDYENELLRYGARLSEISKRSPVPITFMLASGTYGDVLHWIETNQVDMALVTPGVVSEVVLSASSDSKAVWEYIATEARAFPDKKALRDVSTATEMRSVCLVRQDSPVKTVDQLITSAESLALELVLVDPLSVSGYIIPRVALAGLGVPLDRMKLRFSHSHTNSLRLLEEVQAKNKIACVWDGVLEQAPSSQYRRLNLPELKGVLVPPNALIGRSGSEQTKVVSSIIASGRTPEFKIDKDWSERYAEILRWQSRLGNHNTENKRQKFTLADISDTLIHYSKSQPHKPRVAIVFAGGGAKCAYQAGAVRAIEEEFARVRAQTGINELDIHLVVGTSGGAINAAAVALGLSGSDEGYEKFSAAWRDLDRREIISPSLAVRVNMSLWLACLEALLLIGISGLLFRRTPEEKIGLPAWGSLILGAVQIVISNYPGKPWRYFGDNAPLHHIYLWLSYGFNVAGATLVVLGLVTLIARGMKRVVVIPLVPSRKTMIVVLMFIVVGLPALQAWTVLFRRETLSEGAGIESAFVRNFSKLIIDENRRRGGEQISLERETTREAKMAALGQAIFERRLIQRDLVLTASPLAETWKGLPGDLYFYATTSAQSPQPDFGKRGIHLNERPAQFFDALIGSGAIYPVFPSRKFKDYPAPGESADLVDGSFAHRSPLEAAVLWGASHIILVEAAVEEAIPRGNLLFNVSAALTYLYDQAQLSDLRSSEEVTLYTLVPRAPYIGILDFSDNLIAMGIEKGYREARGELSAQEKGVPTFKKQHGPPIFWKVGARL